VRERLNTVRIARRADDFFEAWQQNNLSMLCCGFEA
jgi:hypothetical protein